MLQIWNEIKILTLAKTGLQNQNCTTAAEDGGVGHHKSYTDLQCTRVQTVAITNEKTNTPICKAKTKQKIMRHASARICLPHIPCCLQSTLSDFLLFKDAASSSD
jgi:hypothetical protein